MCWEAYHHDPDETPEAEDPRTHSFLKILFISTVTSIDSLGVGVTLGLAAFASTYLGLGLAKKMPAAFGSRLEIVGGGVLIALGFKMLSI
jgi:putative Mn2+ efflux pump MntP